MMVELPNTFPAIMGSNLADALHWEKMVQKKVNILQDFELDSVNCIIVWSDITLILEQQKIMLH